MDDGAAAGGTGMCRVRCSVRPDEVGEGIRETDGLPGEKTFGGFGSFQCHSPRPEERAKPRRGQSHIPPLRRVRDAAMPSQLHIVILPTLHRWRPPPRVFNPTCH